MCVIGCVSEYVTLQSLEYPDRYCGTDDERNPYLGPSPYRLILIEPGLNEVEGTVSFQAFEDPSIYLCLINYNVIFKSKTSFADDAVFNDLATFYKRPNIYIAGSMAFECYTLTNYFITHDGFQITVHPAPEGDHYPKGFNFIITLPAPNGGKREVLVWRKKKNLIVVW